MQRPQWLLVVLWAFTVASCIAAPTVQDAQPVNTVADAELIPAADIERGGIDDATFLVDIGEGVTKEDGCAKAYDKFKAEVDKMGALKDKAEKKKAEAEKKTAGAESGLKRCKDDQKEVMEKATYKKEVADKMIKEKAKAEFDKMKKKVDDKVKADKKKTDAAMKEAKKKEADATKKSEECKKNLADTTTKLKTKCEKDKSAFKSKTKEEADKKIKVTVEEKLLKETARVKKELQEGFDKKFKAEVSKCDESTEKLKKKCLVNKERTQEEHKEAIRTARKEVPPEVEKELTETKDKLAVDSKALQKSKSSLMKCEATAKETKATMTEKVAKLETQKNDCFVREKSLEKDLSKDQMTVKTQKIKLMEKDSEIERLKQQVAEMKSNLEQKAEALKAKEEELKVNNEKLKETQNKLLEKTNKVKMMMSKMSAGEGALMAEIEGLKKSFDGEKEQNVVVGNHLAKCRANHKETERELNAKTVKLREVGQQLYTAKRDVEKEKTKFDTLTMAHATTTERYRDVSSKRELCEDRMKDAKVKFQGCENAMTRLKTYHADAITDQKMELTRLRQELDTAKKETQRMAVSQEEKQKADQLAKQATEKAVAQAVETANANALAVKANAQEAVDQAAKEAVKAANAKAQAASAAAGSQNQY